MENLSEFFSLINPFKHYSDETPTLENLLCRETCPVVTLDKFGLTWKLGFFEACFVDAISLKSRGGIEHMGALM